ncbi:conserved hypothetical protein [Pediculus humanus corporis]|uniref:CRAL-TRIO domain-containing protein n=1 Tax=Pediculus humanus subsp. corporis TaxID=121224 RepID=E0W2C7_PEDHC|nr:uncharacterized protein Phum_PHUM589680 [Pediculus humanus corporis]EEB19783.1 conserved hypothetical protein [Pediculus humanus corporis]
MAPPVITLSHPFINGCKNLPDDKDEELKEIRYWVSTQPHLPPLKDEHLYLFLHSNYYDLNATKNTIEAYFTIRSTSPELFSSRALRIPQNELTWNITNMVPVPKTTPEGYNVLIYRLSDADTSKLQFVDAMKGFFLFNDIRLSEDGLSPGYIVIFDMKDVCLSHLAKISLSAVRKFMHYIQEGHPARLKGVHVINAVAFMDKILGIVRPLMKTGLIKLLTIHGSNLSNLFKIVPQEILPDDYGGQAESMQKLHDQHRKLVEGNYEKWIDESERYYITDESKRPKSSSKKECIVARNLYFFFNPMGLLITRAFTNNATCVIIICPDLFRFRKIFTYFIRHFPHVVIFL